MSTRTDRLHITSLLLLCIAVFFVGLGVRDLWNIDEGMHGSIALNMLISGDWITPVFQGEPFLDKPPLFNWMNAISFMLFGVNETAARLPAALSGAACVFVTYLLGRRVFDARTGLLAAIIIATSPLVIILSRAVQYDMPFTLFTSLALYFFASAVLLEQRRTRYMLAMYIAVALAFLTKGPLAIVIVGLVAGIYLLHKDRFSLLLQMQIPLGIVIFLVIVTPWFVLMEKANPGYLHYFLYQQHIANYLGDGEGYKPRHVEPFYYYLETMLIGFLPWCLVLPQALLHAIRKNRGVERGMITFLLIWILGIFLFFSAATSKLASYLLPLAPATALILGYYWRDHIDRTDEKARPGLLIATGSVFILLTAVIVYAFIERPWGHLQFKGGVDWHELITAIALLIVIFGATFLMTILRKRYATFVMMALTMPAFMYYALGTVFPDMNPYKSSREIAIELDSLLPPGEKFRYLGHKAMDTTVFYSRRQGIAFATEQQLEQYLDTEQRVYALVQTDARTESEAFKGNYHVIKIIGNKAIVSNMADAD